MLHVPINHSLRPVYRLLAAIMGLYVLAFGIFGITKTGGLGFFAHEGLPWVLGLRANRAFAVLSIVVGAIIVISSIIGRNVDFVVNSVGGIVFLGAGIVMMLLMQTRMNFLGFTMTTCVVSFAIGLVLFTAGLYCKTGTKRRADVEEKFRHGGAPDPTEHVWAFHGAPKRPDDHRYA